ncbi:MAG: hypothetical protein B7Y93_08810 [Micrococcales bacterium 32-70-13]|nr:MAG: hypothetical protein B7Y93_08810 [Micrococcales bacterium 32-70-13]
MILPLLAIGAIGGLFSGLFGVGGGFIMVPLLMAWLRFDQRRASATSLLAIIPPAALSASLYGARGQIDLLAAAIIAIGAIAGTPLGALLLRRISLVWLKWLFIAGLLATALRLVIVVPSRCSASSCSACSWACSRGCSAWAAASSRCPCSSRSSVWATCWPRARRCSR